MPQLTADCPRCGVRHTTFDVLASHPTGMEHSWCILFETFSVCRSCHKPTVFVLRLSDYESLDVAKRKGVSGFEGSANDRFDVRGFVSLKEFARKNPPEHLPAEIQDAFMEGATCHAVKCPNAAATMFRLCVDHATRALLPASDANGLNANIRRSLGLRVRWLLDQGILPETLRDLSTCIREDGNDGAHAGTLDDSDVEDMIDFTILLLERLYTEPERLRLAQARRVARRTP